MNDEGYDWVNFAILAVCAVALAVAVAVAAGRLPEDALADGSGEVAQ